MPDYSLRYNASSIDNGATFTTLRTQAGRAADVWYYSAPPKYLGNQSVLVDGLLHFTLGFVEFRCVCVRVGARVRLCARA